MKTSEVKYPEMLETIWPTCLKIIEQSEQAEIWKGIALADPNNVNSREVFRALVRECMDIAGSPDMEEPLYRVVIVSAYMLMCQYRLMAFKFDMAIPNMKFIWSKCQDIILKNAIEKGKGNSWLMMPPGDRFWGDKLAEEAYEVVTAVTETEIEMPNTMEKELYDVINVASFILHNFIARKRRYEIAGVKPF